MLFEAAGLTSGVYLHWLIHIAHDQCMGLRGEQCRADYFFALHL